MCVCVRWFFARLRFSLESWRDLFKVEEADEMRYTNHNHAPIFIFEQFRSVYVNASSEHIISVDLFYCFVLIETSSIVS